MSDLVKKLKDLWAYRKQTRKGPWWYMIFIMVFIIYFIGSTILNPYFRNNNFDFFIVFLSYNVLFLPTYILTIFQTIREWKEMELFSAGYKTIGIIIFSLFVSLEVSFGSRVSPVFNRVVGFILMLLFIILHLISPYYLLTDNSKRIPSKEKKDIK